MAPPCWSIVRSVPPEAAFALRHAPVPLNPLVDPAARIVIAHRGDRVSQPENTMVALRKAVDMGADAIEFDVRMTRDGVPVLMHDAELDRTTDASGPLRDYSAAQLAGVNAAARFGDGRSASQPVPRLEEVLDAFRAIPMVIEVKEMAAAEATERMVRRFAAEGRVLVGSAENDVMEWFYRTGLATCASVADAARLLVLAAIGVKPLKPRYDVLSVTSRYHGYPIPVRLMAKAALRARIATQVWTVNDPAEARSLWAAGVAGIVTDDPAAMLRARSG